MPYSTEERDDLRMSVNDRQSLIESLSLELIKDNINKQIDYTLNSTTDFLSTVFDKFDMILSMEDLDEEDRQDLRYQIMDFCEQLIVNISNKFNLFVDHTGIDYNSTTTLITAMYNFFVINRCSNVRKFLILYTHTHKHEIVRSLDLDYEKVKDITGFSNKKKNMDKDDVLILSSLSEVINFITTNNIIDPMEFLNVVNDGEVYTSEIVDYFNSATISGNFVNTLFNDVLNDDYDSAELSKIRNELRISFYV
jgi:hypothetical protein